MSHVFLQRYCRSFPSAQRGEHSALTLVVSDGEVWIDVFLSDHGEVEVVSLSRLVQVHSTEQLNELRDTKTRF